MQGYVHISVKNHLKNPIQLDIPATWETKPIHISVLMALPQQWLLPQAKESLSSQPVEESVQKTSATFQPGLMEMKNRALGSFLCQKVTKMISKNTEQKGKSLKENDIYFVLF